MSGRCPRSPLQHLPAGTRQGAVGPEGPTGSTGIPGPEPDCQQRELRDWVAKIPSSCLLGRDSRSLRGWDGGKLGFHIIFSAPLGPQGPFLQLDGLGSACGVFTPEGAVLGLHSSPSGHPAGRSRFSLSIRSHRAGPGLPWGLTDRNPTGAGLWGEPGGRGQGPRSALCPT